MLGLPAKDCFKFAILRKLINQEFELDGERTNYNKASYIGSKEAPFDLRALDIDLQSLAFVADLIDDEKHSQVPSLSATRVKEMD